MSDRKEMNEDIFDLYLKQAESELSEIDFDRAFEEFKAAPEPEYSKAHRKKMKALLRKKPSRAWSRAAAVLIVFCAVGASILSVDAVRTKISNWFAMSSGENISIVNYDEYIPDGWDGAYFITQAPEHLDIVSFNSSRKHMQIVYENGAGDTLKLLQFSDKTLSIILDGENVDIKPIELNNGIAYTFVKEGIITLAWETDKMTFILNSPYNLESTTQIANSVRFLS